MRLDIQTWEPPPPFVWQPSPLGQCQGINMVIKQFDSIACRPGHVGGGRSCNTQELPCFELWFFSTVLLSNRVVSFAWIGLALAFVNNCSRKREIVTIFYHLSPPPVTNFEKPHHLFNPGAKVSYFASSPWLHQVCNCFAWIFPSFWFHNESLCLKAVSSQWLIT